MLAPRVGPVCREPLLRAHARASELARLGAAVPIDVGAGFAELALAGLAAVLHGGIGLRVVGGDGWDWRRAALVPWPARGEAAGPALDAAPLPLDALQGAMQAAMAQQARHLLDADDGPAADSLRWAGWLLQLGEPGASGDDGAGEAAPAGLATPAALVRTTAGWVFAASHAGGDGFLLRRAMAAALRVWPASADAAVARDIADRAAMNAERWGALLRVLPPPALVDAGWRARAEAWGMAIAVGRDEDTLALLADRAEDALDDAIARSTARGWDEATLAWGERAAQAWLEAVRAEGDLAEALWAAVEAP